MANERRYSEQEVRAILERAVRREGADGLSHEDLLEAAREVGISSGAVEEAAREVEEGRTLELARERILARRRSGFVSHLWAFVSVQVVLFAINLLTSPGHWWFVYPLLGWGLALVLSARAAFSKEVSDGKLLREMARSSVSRLLTPALGRAATPRRRVQADAGNYADLESDEGTSEAGRMRRRRKR
jgi:2TM domain